MNAARVASCLLCVIVAGLLTGVPRPAAPADTTEAKGAILAADIVGAIGVATEAQIEAVIRRATETRAELIVFRIDTPGGLVTSTRTIIQAILSSPVPIASFVSPSGARAASAGTYILYASHIAAMAPGTHLGAATPIQLGGAPMPGSPQQPERDRPKDEAGKPRAGMEDKVLNDAVAYIRALAELRGRNADWAEKAVREAATLTAGDAVKQSVADLLANDTADLLRQLDGRSVTMAGGPRKLDTAGKAVVDMVPDWRMRLIATIADPNVAFILMMIGIYGILFELWSPGAFFPGVLGGICLLLGLAALSVLPVNYAGLGLLLLGIALMAGEMFTPGVGALGIGGVVALVIGAAFLFDPDAADIDIQVDWPVIASMALLSAAMAAAVFGFALRSRQRPVATGAEGMIGEVGRVVAWQGAEGTVRVHGELWTARAERALAPGESVRVVRRDGLKLHIDPI